MLCCVIWEVAADVSIKNVVGSLLKSRLITGFLGHEERGTGFLREVVN